jgi:hypothetical protein
MTVGAVTTALPAAASCPSPAATMIRAAVPAATTNASLSAGDRPSAEAVSTYPVPT